jgi:predicted kinase
VRKQLAGLRPEVRAGAPLDTGLYAPGSTDRTYDELLAHARTALGLGESVVLDASWSDPARRAAARVVAEETCSELVELRCAAPPEVVAERTARRAAEGTDASDADPRTAALLAARFAPWPEAHVLDTTRSPDAVLDTATELVRVRGSGPQPTTKEHA